MSGMNRMVVGVIFFLVIVLTLIMFFAVFIHPMLYTVNSLDDDYESISATGDPDAWTSPDEFKATLAMVLWCFVGTVVIGIALMFVYLYALAHKEEHVIYVNR